MKRSVVLKNQFSNAFFKVFVWEKKLNCSIFFHAFLRLSRNFAISRDAKSHVVRQHMRQIKYTISIGDNQVLFQLKSQSESL